MRTEQHTAQDYFFDLEGNRFYPGDGLMPSQCPCYIPNVLPVPGMGSFYDIIPWGSTSILGTYWHYQFYGDRKIIEDNYDAGMRYLEHLKTRVNADAKTLAGFARILGKTEDQKELETYAEEIKKNYNDKLLVQHPEKGYWCYRAFDHPDEIFMTQAFISGEVGLPYIIQTARRYGMNDLIAQFTTHREHPSYYAFILDGETTLGEYWENNPRSHCHDMMGHIIEWYYNGIAGIRPMEPGFGRVEILLEVWTPTYMEVSINTSNLEKQKLMNRKVKVKQYEI